MQDMRAQVEEAFGPLTCYGRWHRQSAYAEIVAVATEDGPWVAKLPVPQLLARAIDRRQQAETINQATDLFRLELARCGVPLPPDYRVAVTGAGYPVHRITDLGEDCAHAVLRDPETLPEILRRIVATLGIFFATPRRAAGLDARLSNFALRNGEVIYFDLFPPLLRRGSQCLVHYPNPTDRRVVEREVLRKFSPFGILRRLRFDVIAMDVALERDFFRALFGAACPVLREALQKFQELPDARLGTLDGHARRLAVRAIPEDDVDTLREVAAKLLPLRGRERRAVMQEVFVATSLATATSEPERRARLERYYRIVEQYGT